MNAITDNPQPAPHPTLLSMVPQHAPVLIFLLFGLLSVALSGGRAEYALTLALAMAATTKNIEARTASGRLPVPT